MAPSDPSDPSDPSNPSNDSNDPSNDSATDLLCYVVAPGTVDVAFDDGASLVRLDAGRALAVNRSAYVVWLACGDDDRGSTLGEVVALVADAFATDVSAIEAEVAVIIDRLVELDLIRVVGAPPPAGHTGCAPDDPRGRTPEPIPNKPDRWWLPIELSPCQKNVDELPWAETVSVGVGRFVVGVRCDCSPTAVILRRLLGDHAVDVPNTPANFSLVLAADAGDHGFPRQGLYEGRTWLTSDARPAHILGTLLARLAGLLPTPVGSLRLSAIGVGSPPPASSPTPSGSMVVLPQYRGASFGAATAWTGAGAELRPAPCLITVEEHRVLTVHGTQNAIEVDPAVAARLGLISPTSRPLHAIVWPGPTVPSTLAECHAGLAPFVHAAPDDDREALLHTLAVMVRSAAIHGYPTDDPVNALPQLFR